MNPFLFAMTRLTGYQASYHTLRPSSADTIVHPAEYHPWSEADAAILDQLSPGVPYREQRGLGYRCRAACVHRLDGAMVVGATGAVVHNGSLVAESVFDVSRMARSPAYRHPSRRPRIRRHAGPCASVFHLPWAASNIYHWFVDVMPRLYAIARSHTGELTLLVPETMPEYQRETLNHAVDAMAPTAVRIETVGPREAVVCEEYLFSPPVAWHESGFLPSPVLEWIRNAVTTGYGASRVRDRRIFISRAGATRRMISNETELHPVLTRFGFEIVRAEDYDYRRQVAMFAGSEAVAGPHGAGLTNLLFSDARTVVELHPAGAARSHYFLLAKGLGAEYEPVFGTVPDNQGNFTVDPTALETALARRFG